MPNKTADSKNSYAHQRRRHPYLERRRNRWYAVMEIPRAKRPALGGRRRFVRSLQTESLSEAQQRVHAVVAAWKEELGGDEALAWRRAIEAAANDPDPQVLAREQAALEWHLDDHYERGDPEAVRFYRTATGALVETTRHLDEWLAGSSATQKTRDMQRSDVRRFAERFPTVQDVRRPEVRRWITELMNGDDGLTPKTVQRVLSALRGYWRYLQSIEVASEEYEPFARLDVARRAKKGDPKAARQPFAPGDVLRLLDAAAERDDDQLADLIRLGMWTGCRIEELCALKTDQVGDESLTVEDAKTAAGHREVPIHKELAQTMARLIEESEDGHVLSGLTTNKYGDRSNGIGKRFGRLKSDLGFGQQHVFHSVRKTVVTQLENAGVSENVVADIVGHEKPTMTYGLYSGGTSLAVKAEALAKLAY